MSNKLGRLIEFGQVVDFYKRGTGREECSNNQFGTNGQRDRSGGNVIEDIMRTTCVVIGQNCSGRNLVTSHRRGGGGTLSTCVQDGGQTTATRPSNRVQ